MTERRIELYGYPIPFIGKACEFSYVCPRRPPRRPEAPSTIAHAMACSGKGILNLLPMLWRCIYTRYVVATTYQ